MALVNDFSIDTKSRKPVSAVAINLEKREVYTSHDGSSIKCWNLDTGVLLRTLVGHRGTITFILYCPPLKSLISGGLDHVLNIWVPSKGEVVARERFRCPVMCCTFNRWNDQLIVGGKVYVFVYNVKYGAEKGAHLEYLNVSPLVYFEDHSDFVTSVLCTKMGRMYTVGLDGRVCVYDPSVDGKPKFVTSKKIHAGGIAGAAYDSTKDQLFTGSFDHTIKCFANEPQASMVPLWTTKTDSAITSVGVSSPSSSVWAALKNGNLSVLDQKTGADLSAYRNASSSNKMLAYKIAMSKTGMEVVVSTIDRQLHVYKHSQSACVSVCRGHTDWVEWVAHVPLDNSYVTGGSDRQVLRWQQLSHQHHDILIPSGSTLRGHTGDITCGAVSPDSQRLATGSADASVRIWTLFEDPEAAGLENFCKRVFVGHKARVCSVAWISDEVVASSAWDHTVRLWNADSGMAGAVLSLEDITPQSLAFSPAFGLLGAACSNGMLLILDPSDLRTVNQTPRLSNELTHVRFNLSGRCWYTAGSDGAIRAFNNALEQLEFSRPKSDGISTLDVDQNTGFALVGLNAPGRPVAVIDVLRDKELVRYSGHMDSVTGVSHAKGSSLYVTCSWDRTLRLWQRPSIQMMGNMSMLKRGQSIIGMGAGGDSGFESEYSKNNPILIPASISSRQGASLGTLPPTTVIENVPDNRPWSRVMDVLDEVERDVQQYGISADELHATRKSLHHERMDKVSKSESAGVGVEKTSRRTHSDLQQNARSSFGNGQIRSSTSMSNHTDSLDQFATKASNLRVIRSTRSRVPRSQSSML